MARRPRSSYTKNVTRLRRKLRRMPDEVVKPIRDEIEDAAQEIHYEALSRIPVRTGDLAQALTWRTGRDGLSARIGFWKKGNLKRWRLGGWRGHFVEFGTVNMPAKPFLQPAWDSVIPRFKVDLDRKIDAALRRVSNMPLSDTGTVTGGFDDQGKARVDFEV